MDECLGREVIPAALRAAGAKVEIHCDHFESGAPDEDWLRAVGVRRWVVLTKDKRIRRHGVERAALESAGVTAFVLTGGSMSGKQMADAFVRALPKMLRVLDRHQPPFIATVTAAGEVKPPEAK